MSFNVNFSVREVAKNRYTAVASINGENASGTGSSSEVACSVAVRTLLSIPGVTKTKDPV